MVADQRRRRGRGRGMSALSKSSIPPHLFDDSFPPRQASRIGFFLRDRDRQQEINRDAQRTGKLLMKDDGPLALSGFEVGQISLTNSDGYRELCLRHIPPFAQHSNRI